MALLEFRKQLTHTETWAQTHARTHPLTHTHLSLSLCLPLSASLPQSQAYKEVLGLDDGSREEGRTRQLVEFIRDVLLFNNAALQPVQQPNAPANTAPPLPPPGLSRKRLNALVDKRGAVFRCSTREDVVALKLALVDVLSQPKAFNGRDVAVALLTAAGDKMSDIADRAVLGLRRVGASSFRRHSCKAWTRLRASTCCRARRGALLTAKASLR